MKRFLYMSFVCLILMACNKDENEEGKVSYADVDWYAIEDSDDPLDHLIYTCYDEYGVAIFYEDTIGRVQTGTSFDGTPRMHYEVLDVNYMITTKNDQNSYTESRDREALTKTVEFLKTDVLPRLPESVQPRCYFLTDSCITYRKTYITRVAGKIIEGCDDFAWRALATTMIGRVGRMENELPSVWAKYAGEILAADVTLKLVNHYAFELQEFYDLSENVHVPEVLSGSSKKTIYGQRMNRSNRDYPFQHWNLYGFLNFSEVYNPDNQDADRKGYTAPLQTDDLRAFVTAYYQYTEEEFKALYTDYEVILAKYDVIKKIVEKL